MNGAPRHLIVRTGWLFGSYGRSYLSQLLEKRGSDEVVFGFDDQRSQPTYEMDFVDALIGLVKQNQTGVWHVASGGEASQYEFAQAVYESLGLDASIVKPLRRGAGARAALRPRFSVLDCSKLEAAGIRMRPWLDALREHLASLVK